MGPHPGLPALGPGGAGLLAFGAGLGAAGVPGPPGTPHTAAAVAQAHPLLKPEMHRAESADMKPGLVAEERLVSGG